MNNNIFETATRCKYRFPSTKGTVSVEDLWDLSKEQLDSTFKTLNSQIKVAKEESLLVTRSTEDNILSNKIEIVKYIFNIKQIEENERLYAKERKEKKQELLAAIEFKKKEEILGKSVAELQAMLDEI